MPIKSIERFCACCLYLILHLYYQLQQEKDSGRLLRGFGLKNLQKRAANYLGISERSLRDIVNNPEKFEGRDKPFERETGVRMEAEDMENIRPAIAKLKVAKKPVRLDSILHQIQLDNPEWKWGRTTLWEAMKEIGITYRKRKNWRYEMLREDPANCLRRAHYLEYFFVYEEEGRLFYFHDESWVNKNEQESKAWSDGTLEFEIDMPPAGKGERFVMMGCGSKHGWLNGTWCMWTGDNVKDDYHGEMNRELFEQWINDDYFPNAADKSVLVIDRAKYHTMLTDETRCATKSMTRPQLAKWLTDHQARDDNLYLYTYQQLLKDTFRSMKKNGKMGNSKGYPKSMLYAMCRDRDPKPRYQIQKWFDDYNIENPGRDLKVLMLPVAHPTLNPIEMMWNRIKTWVRKWNKDYTMARVKELVDEARAQQGAAEWTSVYERMRRYAVDQWEADELLLNEQDGEEEDDAYAFLVDIDEVPEEVD
jgi:hypothetical protein